MSDRGVIVIGCSVAFVALMTSFTVVAVSTDDPDVFYQFLGGQFLGNLGTFVVLVVTAVLSKRVSQVSTKVEKVEANTNGTTTRLIEQNDAMTRHIMQSGGDPESITRLGES